MKTKKHYDRTALFNEAIDYIYNAGMSDEENERFADTVIREIDRMVEEYELGEDEYEISDEDFRTICDLAFALADQDATPDFTLAKENSFRLDSLRDHGVTLPN